MRVKDEAVSVALPSRQRLFLVLLARCLMALFFAGVTAIGGLLLLLVLVLVTSGDRAMVDAMQNPFIDTVIDTVTVAVIVAASSLIFAVIVYGMQKATEVNLLPPPHLPEDDDQ